MTMEIWEKEFNKIGWMGNGKVAQDLKSFISDQIKQGQREVLNEISKIIMQDNVPTFGKLLDELKQSLKEKFKL